MGGGREPRGFHTAVGTDIYFCVDRTEGREDHCCHLSLAPVSGQLHQGGPSGLEGQEAQLTAEPGPLRGVGQ